jgi:microcystin-dependent protein
MTQIKCPIDYVPLQQVTAANLNAHVNNATLQPGAVHEQTVIGSLVATDDEVLVYDASATALRSSTAANLLGSNLDIVTSNVGGPAAGDVKINPHAGSLVTGKVFTSDGTNVTVTSTAHGLVTGNFLTFTASVAAYSGTYKITVTGVDTFTYVINPTTTASGGTLSYTKVGVVHVTGSEHVEGNLVVDSNVSVSGSITVGNTPLSVSLVPAGAVMPFAMATAPAGWVACDGSTHNTTEESGKYALLYAAIGNLYGGTNSTDFKLPDLRGLFIRGVDTFTSTIVTAVPYVCSDGYTVVATRSAHGMSVGQIITVESATNAGFNGTYTITETTTDTFKYIVGRKISTALSGTLSYTNKNNDGGRTLGSTQQDAIERHKHNFNDDAFIDGNSWVNGKSTIVTQRTSGDAENYYGVESFTSDGDGTYLESGNNSNKITYETRPKNIALLYCIKY